MADYKVGNLQIVFNAIDETSKSFNSLARNLKTIKTSIINLGNIGETDLNKFANAVGNIQKGFAPLLDNINGASGALKDFNELTQKLGITKVADVAQAFQELNNKMKEAKENIAQFTTGVSEGGKELDKPVTKSIDNFQDLNLQLLATQQQLKLLNSQYAKAFKANGNIEIIGQQIIATKQKIEALKEEIKSLNSTPIELEEVADELEDTDKNAKKTTSSFSKFFASLKRIALYRAIRTVLSSITGALREGVSSLANFDKGFNQTMSSITTSLTVIKTSLGSIVMPILTAIAPVLQQISVGFANLGNVINASMAKMQGLATYTKINTDKLLAYGEASKGVLLDFDKFRSLGSQEDSILSEESIESINGELGVTKSVYGDIFFLIQNIGDLLGNVLRLINTIANSTAFQTIIGIVSKIFGGITWIASKLIWLLDKSGLIEPILWGVFAVLVAIGATKIITWFSSGKFIELFTTLITKLHLTKKGLSSILTSTQALTFAIGAFVGAVAYWASSLKDMGSTAKWLVPVLSGLIAVLVGIAVAKSGIEHPFKAAVTAGLLTAAVGLAVGTAAAKAVQSARSVEQMANGGVPSVGTLFYAGEAGAETVTVGNSGRTEVTNVNQMEQALYNALVRYGNQNRSGGDSGAININIDGQRVFEATRRVANKRGLDFSKV